MPAIDVAGHARVHESNRLGMIDLTREHVEALVLCSDGAEHYFWEDGKPHIHRARIMDLATFEKRLSPESLLLPPVCWAITQLRNFLPIRSVMGLPDPPRANHGLTESGQFIPIYPHKNARVIHGAVFVTSRTTAEASWLSHNRYIILDLSEAPPRLLSKLTYSRSTLRSFNDVTLEGLTNIDGDVAVVGGTSLNTPNLKSVAGSQFLHRARNVHQPLLEVVAYDNQP